MPEVKAANGWAERVERGARAPAGAQRTSAPARSPWPRCHVERDSRGIHVVKDMQQAPESPPTCW